MRRLIRMSHSPLLTNVSREPKPAHLAVVQYTTVLDVLPLWGLFLTIVCPS
jgi:hypothetical protein